MHPDPMNSTKKIADHRWDEQDQHELYQHKDRLQQLNKKLELLGKEEHLDDFHDHLEGMCKWQLQRVHEQEKLDSDQRCWETGEGYIRLVMKTLDDMGKEKGYENWPKEEIERQFKVQAERDVKEALERLFCRKWADYFQQSLGVQRLQDLPDDLPEFRRQIERLRRRSLRDWQQQLLHIEDYLSLQKESDKFSRGVDTNNDISSICVPNSVRVQAQGSHNNMEENVRTTVGSLGYASDESSALLAVPTSEHFRLNSPGGEGSDGPRSNHSPIITSSTEANRVPLVEQLAANQSQYTSYSDKPEVILDNQAQANCTGNFSVLSNLTIGRDNIAFVAANGELMETFMSGSVCRENIKLPNVHFTPGLGDRIIVSGSMLDKAGYGYEFGQGKFTVKDLKNNGMTVGEGRLDDRDNYVLDFLTIARAPEQPGLLSTVWNEVCSAFHRLGLKN